MTFYINLESRMGNELDDYQIKIGPVHYKDVT